MAARTNPPKAPRRWADLDAGAAYLGCSTRTLRRYGASGRLTLYRVGPRAVRVDLDELDALARPIPTATAKDRAAAGRPTARSRAAAGRAVA